jgi:transmembrane sensor
MRDVRLSSLKRAEKAGMWCRIIAERPLTPEETDDFETWFEADAKHRAAFERATFMWRVLDGSHPDPELLTMRMKALSSLAGQNDEPVSVDHPIPAWWQRPLVRRTGFGALAASIVAAISFAVLQSAPAPTSVPASKAVEYATALGERRVVMLGDGSRLSMDAASQVSVEYSGDKRELVLKSGRAKFDVAKDPLKPFTVAAGDKLIVATGTSFSVEVLNGEVNVILFEGHVAVLDRATKRPAVVPSSGTMEAADALLKPGQELSLPANGMAKLDDVDMAFARSWEAGQLSFEDEPLGQAIERINRYSPKKFVVGDPAAGRVRISGVFNSDDIDGFVSDMALVFPVKAVRRGNDVVFVTQK